MAIYPWIVPYKKQKQNLGDFPNLRRWFEVIAARPAVQRAYQRASEINVKPVVTEASRAILFGQTAARR
jgi:GST-like protein